MNLTEQRTAIAGHLGFTKIRWSNRWELSDDPTEPIVLCGIKDGDLQVVPDYPASLDAMHEAEKSLTPEQSCVYVNLLAPLGYSIQTAVYAPAGKRAVAFLKALNLS